MSDAKKILFQTALRMAGLATDPNERIDHLKTASKLCPDDEDLAGSIEMLEWDLKRGPAIVAIEQARTIGVAEGAVVGRIFVVQPNGYLKPADGRDLVDLEERHPGFARDWRLSED